MSLELWRVDRTDSDSERVVEAGESPTDSAAPDTESTVVDRDYADRNSDAYGAVDPDASAESFLSIERDLASLSADADATKRHGRVVNAQRVGADVVPDDYPVPISTDDALALTLEINRGTSTRTATTYFAWPDGDTGRLHRLLAVTGTSLDTFADLNGARLLVTARDGYVVPVIPETSPRGDKRGIYGVLAGVGVNVGTLLALAGSWGVIASGWFVVAFLLVNLFVIPASTYLDGRYLETHTDWDHDALFWSFISLPPLANLVVSLAYLWTRRGATPLTQ